MMRGVLFFNFPDEKIRLTIGSSEDKNNSYLFNDTTRLRMISRPSLKEAFGGLSNNGTSTRLGRRGISQSFKEKVACPSRPKDPPPPPPGLNKGSSKVAVSKKRSSSTDKVIYDIAEQEEAESAQTSMVRILHTNSSSAICCNTTGSLKRVPSKPPRTKKERSQSFNPKSKSLSNSSLDESNKSNGSDQNLITIVPHEGPEEERLTFKDIRKILSSPSISSNSSGASVNKPPPAPSTDHIYEEIPSEKDKARKNSGTVATRPLPPLPKDQQHNNNNNSKLVSLTSHVSTNDDEDPVKSIFVGATKYEILHYLEDAKERGVPDLELDVEDVEEEQQDLLADRHHANRVSQFSNDSKCSSGSSSGSAVIIHGKDRWTSVDIERNDSGLGSETGKAKRPIRIRDKNSSGQVQNDGSPEQICEDCDQPIEDTTDMKGEEVYDATGSVCIQCAKRRCERKEIITEIIETEIKYGRDLRIILEEFYRPMQVAGLLSQEQLSAIFLNVEELVDVNRQFTEALKDAIEIALDEGDEDLCTVKIGQLFKTAEPMLGAFKSYCTRQGSSSALLAALEKERELLRIFLRVSQMENTILRRMNLSSFLMVPVQRVTKYPLLLSRLLKVTPSHHEDRTALQEGRERIEHHLEHMNQEARDTNSTRLWRRISMINVSSYRKMDNQLDVLGNTTWGIRKMALDVLQWTKESREDVNFVLEGKLMFTQATEPNWRRVWTVKMTPVSALLVTLGRNSLEPPSSLHEGCLQFPVDTGVKEAALLLIREKNNRYSMIREPIFLGNCVICWEQDWEDCFEVQEFVAKESLIFKGDDISRTRQWFKALQFYGLSLGNWRRRRNALANIMINGTSRSDET